MFSAIDKNLLIAALESAIYHACLNANVVSLHAIETGVSALRQRFDATPETVSDEEIFLMIDTIERATIPVLSHISAIDNDTNIADRVVSYLWKNIVGKPATFPPAAHQHPWGEVTFKPATFPPATHQHVKADISDFPATMTPDAHSHAYSEITDTPATFPPSPHEHPEYAGGGATWDTLADKPATFPPSPHEHPQYALAGSGGGGGAIVRTWMGNETTGAWFNFPATFVPQAMLIYEYEHGFRGLWTQDVTPYIMYDDGTADEFTLQETGFTFPPGILCCKQGKWYYAILWS